ncbi:ghrelin O-acyltransferase [Megalops cyprinoides]|uniref:ghrelin O-acyltransferase n=1 Tax=Megalops cyprinoides TaxID=118141 RepID=UPI001863D980|nr:ghrelin O-acyltransferase [Megalops cyprinoides]
MNFKPVLQFSWSAFEQYPQLVYQLSSVPFAMLFYGLAKRECLTLIHRYIYLTFGGCILAAVTMGPYCWLVFVAAVASVLLVHSLCPLHIHPWMFGVQMCWQTFWHLLIQYNEYWLQKSTDNRLLLAVSSLMLLTQRMTSLSMDIKEGNLTPPPSGTSVWSSTTLMLPYLSYTLYFPALLGGPLCSFQKFVSFVEQSSITPPPHPLHAVCCKVLFVLALEYAKYLLAGLIKSYCVSHLSALGGILWVWGLSLVLRMSYYSHWALSESLNNAAGLGFTGYSSQGTPLWDGVSDGDPWTIEMSSRPSVFARRWNGTTALWLRRLVFQNCKIAPLALTFGFSAWWHGLHPGQILGFLSWAATVQADYFIHQHLCPLLDTQGKQVVYTCLSWAQTQLVIACVVVAVELRSASALWLFCKTYIAFFPLLYIVLLFFITRRS